MAKYISVEITKKALADSDLIPRYAENCKPITDRIIDSLPAADVSPVRHGHWIEYQIPHIICCSNCDWATDVVEKNFQYCPMCGTQMDGGV